MIQNKECYPRPDMIRENWVDLNGSWQFIFDDADCGEREEWFKKEIDGQTKIKVPFCYQSEASGVEDKSGHEIMWYEKTIFVDGKEEGGKCLLHFGAVDYEAKVWVNGNCAGMHQGGNCAFMLDISAYIRYGAENRITVRAKDENACWQPRGKQYWKEEASRIWYTPVSGIWKSVWLEFTGNLYVRQMLLTPDIDSRCVKAEIILNRSAEKEVSFHGVISHNGEVLKRMMVTLSERSSVVTIDLKEGDYADEIQYWSPENPWLYDIDICLEEAGIQRDKISGYFGMRKIEIKGNGILLNNKPYYQKLVLDQGYWKKTLLTPPDVSALAQDIQLAKEMGFNGARKHQKVEDARYYYLAAKMGFLVWGEMPSAYHFCTMEMECLIEEWLEFIQEAYNHPSIVMWVPLNESWGVRNIVSDHKQQKFALMLYELTKAIDNTRLVSNNDGWEQISGSDICGIHDYTADGERMEEKYHSIEKCLKSATEHRLIYAHGHEFKEKPILLTEFGGIAFADKSKKSWGYYGAVENEEAFFDRFANIMKAVGNVPEFAGYCYTQFTDVFQEANGLLDFARQPKVNMERIKEINNSIGF